MGLKMSVTLNGVEWLCKELCCKLCRCCRLVSCCWWWWWWWCCWCWFVDFGDRLITRSTPFKSGRSPCSWSGSSAKPTELLASVVDIYAEIVCAQYRLWCIVHFLAVSLTIITSITLAVIMPRYILYCTHSRSLISCSTQINKKLSQDNSTFYRDKIIINNFDARVTTTEIIACSRDGLKNC